MFLCGSDKELKEKVDQISACLPLKQKSAAGLPGEHGRKTSTIRRESFHQHLASRPKQPGNRKSAECSDLSQKRLSPRLSKKKGIRDLKLIEISDKCLHFTSTVKDSDAIQSPNVERAERKCLLSICTDPELRKPISSTALQEQLTEIIHAHKRGSK